MSSRMFKLAGLALILVFVTVPSGTANDVGNWVGLNRMAFSGAVGAWHQDESCVLRDIPDQNATLSFSADALAQIDGRENVTCFAELRDQGDPAKGGKFRVARSTFYHDGEGLPVKNDYYGRNARIGNRGTRRLNIPMPRTYPDLPPDGIVWFNYTLNIRPTGGMEANSTQIICSDTIDGK